MKFCFFFCTGVFLFLASALFSELPAESLEKEPGTGVFAKPLFTWSFLWSGAWEDGKDLTQRGDLRLLFPWPGLTLRSEILDRQPAEFRWPWEGSSVFTRNFDGSGAAIQSGLYQNSTGSRLLYGLLDEWGLPARLHNTWQRSAPFVENRKPSMADLKTSPVSSTDPEAYLYLGSPWLNLPLGTGGGAPGPLDLRSFGFARFGQSERPAFGGGLEGQFGKKADISLEGFYTGWTIPARKGSTWFSENPPLPERNFRLFGLGLLVDTPFFGLGSDWALSETFAWGRDLYGALGLRIGRAGMAALWGWQLSLTADGAGARFTGSNGSSPGPGFRTGAKLEWRGRGGNLFRANTTLRSPGLWEPLNRISAGLYYRLPTGQSPFSVSRISLSADCDRRDQEEPLDGIDGTIGFVIKPRAFSSLDWLFDPLTGLLTGDSWNSPFSLQVSASLKGIPPDSSRPDYTFYSVRAGGDLLWSPKFFQFRLGMGYGEQSGKEALRDFSFSAGVHGKPGRLGIKIASADFPDDWTWTFSWRLEKK